MDKQRGIKLKIIIIWLTVLLLGSFWLTARTGPDSVGLAVLPHVPREGEPIVVTFKLNNPSSQAISTEYRLYANSELITEGNATIPPGSNKTYQYAYENPLLLGEQVHFMVKTESPWGSREKLVSLPSYPPYIWSSFVSFAAFSTSMMGFMSSMTYFQSNFGSQVGANMGLLFCLVLMALLIFAELTQVLRQRQPVQRGSIAILGRLRIRFGTVTWILFIIFVGIVYTRVMMYIIG